MTTFKGFVRSSIATARRIEKANQRRNREIAANFKRQQKEQDLRSAAETVDSYNDYINLISSIHKECSEPINWIELLNQEPPALPVYNDSSERELIDKIKNFKPTILIRILGNKKSILSNLEKQLPDLRMRNQIAFEQAIEKHKKELTQWEEMKLLYQSVIDKNIDAYKAALDEFNVFDEINGLGSKINMTIQPDKIEVDLHVNSAEVIPTEARTLTSTGKLSVKKIPISKFNEIYQDYVCGCVLRIANELFAALPIDTVLVHAMSEMLNTSNGHIEEQPVLSVLIPKESIKKMNMRNIDCSDSMKNFNHNMSFSKTTGFKPIPKLAL